MTSSADAAVLARKAHRTLEPLHVIGYFSPEPGERYASLGIKGGMRGYFASRSAALGVVPLEVVIATFFNFAPDLIAKAIPSVWESSTPEAVIQARYAATSDAYRRVLGEEVLASEEMVEAAALAREAATGLKPEGRPLYAAHAAVDWPGPTHLQLFHAQTLLREYRGDGHIAALVLAGLDAVEALVTYVPLGEGMPEAMIRSTRGWSDEAWDAAVGRVQERGLLDADRGLTSAGTTLRQQVEDQTDAADAAAYLQLGTERTERLRSLARPWSKAITAAMFGA
ncbi:MAG TPA: hypothetical protein VHV79_05730 [Mycobacteriales bacterium]|jgi:hypothetical protein|nr:hypothetical protein [Mycobacteriales bacterium]